MPSRRRQIAIADARFVALSVNGAWPARSLAEDSVIALYPRAVSASCVASGGMSSGATRYANSPSMRSNSRLVARMVAWLHWRRTVSANRAAASTTWSQLSRSSRRVAGADRLSNGCGRDLGTCQLQSREHWRQRTAPDRDQDGCQFHLLNVVPEARTQFTRNLVRECRLSNSARPVSVTSRYPTPNHTIAVWNGICRSVQMFAAASWSGRTPVASAARRCRCVARLCERSPISQQSIASARDRL